MEKTYNSTKRCTQIGDGTVGALNAWLEHHINVIFPENGIYWWSDNKSSTDHSAFKPGDKLPGLASGQCDIHHVACYARRGNECRIIEVNLAMNDHSFRSLTSIKVFGSEDDTWAIVRAIEAALCPMFDYGDIPIISELYDKLPKAPRNNRVASITGMAVLHTTDSTLSLRCGDLVIEDMNFSELGESAKWKVMHRKDDWIKILTGLKAEFELIQTGPGALADYTFSDRGLRDLIYVLAPGGNPKDDRHWIGCFPTLALAIEAASAHRDAGMLRPHPPLPDMMAEFRTWKKQSAN